MNITICIGSSCHLKGSRKIINTLDQLSTDNNLQDQVTMAGSFCMGRCTEGVCVTLDGEFFSLTPETAEDFFNNEVLRRIEQ